jgi:transcriptional regulator with XRE-family HTH domain
VESIGKQIWKQRKASGMSQNDLREQLGFKSVGTIQSWESDRVVPRIDDLDKMHDKFGWEFDVKWAVGNNK